MADRLTALRIVDPVLTTLARGYANAAYIAEILFPLVGVEKEAGKVPQFGKEAFAIYKTERALRGETNRINPDDVDSIPFILEEHDLGYPVDYREEAESLFNVQRRGMFITSAAIQLRREKMAADLAQNADKYPTGNKITLAGTDQFTDADSDPVGVIEDGKDAIRAKIGVRPNTMAIGPDVFKSLKHHPQLVEKIKYSMKGVLTIELLQTIFDVPNIVVGEAVYRADGATDFTDVWGDNIVLAYVPEAKTDVERDVYEPSYGYTLRKTGNPVVDTYDKDKKLQIVRTTDIFEVAMLGAEAGYLIKDTNG